MRSVCAKPTVIACAALLLVATASARTATHSSSVTSKSGKSVARTAARTAAVGRKATTKSARGKSRHEARGQQAMGSDRVRQIQTALIRAHYLSGAATGQWDARSKGAMQQFQADNHWQTKKIPDSRALIKLGLGPDRANLLNPDTAYMAPAELGKASPEN